MQRQIRIDGKLAGCRKCGAQPKHWEDFRGNHTHALECSPCANMTPYLGTFQEAVEYWEKANQQERIDVR